MLDQIVIYGDVPKKTKQKVIILRVKGKEKLIIAIIIIAQNQIVTVEIENQKVLMIL